MYFVSQRRIPVHRPTPHPSSLPELRELHELWRPDGTTGSAPTTDDLKKFVERYDALRARAKSA